MTSHSPIQWDFLDFPALDTTQLYAILKARAEIFSVEQQCAYCDLDNLDQKAHHLIGWGAPHLVAAYLRLVAPGARHPEPTFGRIITTADYRGVGLGRKLVWLGIEYAEKLYPGQPIRMAVRGYLEKFYQEFGFAAISEPYEAYGVPFVDMLCAERKN